jgi:hypothetical protein
MSLGLSIGIIIWPVGSFKTSLSTIHPSKNYHSTVHGSVILNPSSHLLVSLPMQYIFGSLTPPPPSITLHPSFIHLAHSPFSKIIQLSCQQLGLIYFELFPKPFQAPTNVLSHPLSVLPSLYSHSKNPPKIMQPTPNKPVIPMLSNQTPL